jgi:hypothetical protein
MTVKIYKNFLTIDECEELNKISMQAVNQGYCCKGLEPHGLGNYDLRYSTRLNMANKQYPEFVYAVSKKVTDFMQFQNFTTMKNTGSNGIVTSVMFKDGDLFEHMDGQGMGLKKSYRCNVVTQHTGEGGDLYVDNKKVDINVGDLHCYDASSYLHKVTTYNGNIPRIIWMFSYLIPKEKLDEFCLS